MYTISMIIHYDLFAGIGGFSLALDTIFHDYERRHIFCEWEAFPTAVLKKHWPDATYYGDIADLVADTGRKYGQPRADGSNGQPTIGASPTSETERFVIVTGGFPCQPFSAAGRRKGTADDRYKWPEMFAVIRNVRPDWIIAENVRGLVTWNEGMVLETVCADLESEGYEVQPLIIPAVAVGAPHRRDRVWIVAHANRGEQRAGLGRLQEAHGEIPKRDDHAEPSYTSSNLIKDSYLAGSGKREPQEQVSERNKRHTITGNDERVYRETWDADWREVALTTCHDGVDDGLPRWMDGVAISASRHRKERLKACGNAIVPQVAMEIFTAIRQTIE